MESEKCDKKLDAAVIVLEKLPTQMNGNDNNSTSEEQTRIETELCESQSQEDTEEESKVKAESDPNISEESSAEETNSNLTSVNAVEPTTKDSQEISAEVSEDATEGRMEDESLEQGVSEKKIEEVAKADELVGVIDVKEDAKEVKETNEEQNTKEDEVKEKVEEDNDIEMLNDSELFELLNDLQDNLEEPDNIFFDADQLLPTDLPTQECPATLLVPNSEHYKSDLRKYRYSRVIVLAPFLLDDWANAAIAKHLQICEKYEVKAVRKTAQMEIIGQMEMTFSHRGLAGTAKKEIAEAMTADYANNIKSHQNIIFLTDELRHNIITVSGIPSQVMVVDKLQAIFPNCLSVIPGVCMQTQDYGYAYLEYESAEQAKKALKYLKEKNASIGSWKLRVDYLKKGNLTENVASINPEVKQKMKERKELLEEIVKLERRLKTLKQLGIKRPLNAVQCKRMTQLKTEVRFLLEKQKLLEKKWPELLKLDEKPPAKTDDKKKNSINTTKNSNSPATTATSNTKKSVKKGPSAAKPGESEETAVVIEDGEEDKKCGDSKSDSKAGEAKEEPTSKSNVSATKKGTDKKTATSKDAQPKKTPGKNGVTSKLSGVKKTASAKTIKRVTAKSSAAKKPPNNEKTTKSSEASKSSAATKPENGKTPTKIKKNEAASGRKRSASTTKSKQEGKDAGKKTEEVKKPKVALTLEEIKAQRSKGEIVTASVAELLTLEKSKKKEEERAHSIREMGRLRREYHREREIKKAARLSEQKYDRRIARQNMRHRSSERRDSRSRRRSSEPYRPQSPTESPPRGYRSAYDDRLSSNSGAGMRGGRGDEGGLHMNSMQAQLQYNNVLAPAHGHQQDSMAAGTGLDVSNALLNLNRIVSGSASGLLNTLNASTFGMAPSAVSTNFAASSQFVYPSNNGATSAPTSGFLGRSDAHAIQQHRDSYDDIGRQTSSSLSHVADYGNADLQRGSSTNYHDIGNEDLLSHRRLGGGGYGATQPTSYTDTGRQSDEGTWKRYEPQHNYSGNWGDNYNSGRQQWQ